MNISSGENSLNKKKKNPVEYIVPPPSRGSEQKASDKFELNIVTCTSGKKVRPFSNETR